MKYPFKYPLYVLVVVPFIPAAIAFTHEVLNTPRLFPLRWTFILGVWGALVAAAIGIMLDTYVPEEPKRLQPDEIQE
jgi:hypothetical protein